MTIKIEKEVNNFIQHKLQNYLFIISQLKIKDSIKKLTLSDLSIYLHRRLDEFLSVQLLLRKYLNYFLE